MAAMYFIFLLFFAGLFLFTLSEKIVDCDTSKCLTKEDVQPPSCGDTTNDLKTCFEDGKSSPQCSEEEKNKTRSRLDALRTIQESYCDGENFQKEFETTSGCWKSVAGCSIIVITKFLVPMSDKPRDSQSSECKNVLEGLRACQLMSANACKSKDFRIKFLESVERVSQCGECKLVASFAILLLILVGNVFLFN